MSFEEERRIWALHGEFYLDGQKSFGSVILFETFLKVTGTNFSMDVPLTDILDAHEEIRKGTFTTKKMIVISLNSGKKLTLEIYDNPSLYVNALKSQAKLAPLHWQREEEVKKLLNAKPVTCEFAFQVEQMVETMRKKAGLLQKEEHASRIITVYIPFAVCEIHGPPHVKPKHLLVRLALPHEYVSLITYRSTRSSDAVALLNMMFPFTVRIPLLRRFVPLNCSPNDNTKIVVPPDITVMNAINTAFSAIQELMNRITTEYQAKYNEEVIKYNSSVTSYGQSYHATNMDILRKNYDKQIKEINDALLLRFFPEPISKVDLIYTFFLPYLYVEYETDAGSKRIVILSWMGNDATAELLPAIDQILNNRMYNGTVEFYDELITSLITNGDINGAKYMYDEAMTLYPRILKKTFDEYLESARNVYQQSTPQKDYWSVLGLRPGASKEVIAAAYKELIKQYHPDKLPEGATPAQRKLIEDKVKEINEAYEALMKE